MFGMNSMIGCSVYVNRTTLSEQCSNLKKQSYALMTGVEYSKMKKTEKFVATFGNTARNKPGDWVNLILINLLSSFLTTLIIR